LSKLKHSGTSIGHEHSEEPQALKVSSVHSVLTLHEKQSPFAPIGIKILFTEDGKIVVISAG